MKRASPRQAVGRFIVAVSESCPDLLYATGFIAPDPFLWFRVNGREAVVMNRLELGRARREVRRGVEVLSEAEARARFGVPDDRRATAENLLAAVARQTGVRTWETTAGCPLGLARRLARRGLRILPVDDLFPQRACKEPAEVRAIRGAVALAEAGLAHALAILRSARAGADGGLEWNGAPLTSERLRGELCAVIARGGGWAAHTIVAGGTQGADPHGTGSGVLRAGEPIVLDIFPRAEASGYFGDLTRTVVKGRAPRHVRAAFAAVRAAQRAALAAIRAGVSLRRPYLAAVRELERRGFRTDLAADPPRGFIHGLGHGLGLEIHEAPRLGSAAAGRLRVGQVVTVEPGWYDPAWGGIRIEDVVVVTARGWRRLTRAPVCLELP